MKANQISREERVATTLPVRVGDGILGLTRDVSVTGIFFEINNTNTAYESGSSIDFEVEMEIPTGAMTLKCRGNIARTESRNGKIGIAVKIADSFFEKAPGKRI